MVECTNIGYYSPFIVGLTVLISFRVHATAWFKNTLNLHSVFRSISDGHDQKFAEDGIKDVIGLYIASYTILLLNPQI